jgi:hypothetical protein
MASMWRSGVLVLAGALVAAGAWAAPVKIFQEASADAFLAGKLEGVAVADDGALSLAPAARRLAAIEEPYAFALTALPHGWAVGTGNDGRVLEIGDDGKTRILYDAPESEIFALCATKDGTIYAGSSPDGKLYRIGEKGAEVVFDPQETYIWAIADAGGGALWVATGAPGRLYRVSAAGQAEKVWDGGAAHVRSLLVLPDGDLLFGTAGDGRILRWHGGAVRTVYDSELTEVAALAAGPDGTIWAALLASEASFVDQAPHGAATASSDAGGGTPDQAVVVVEAAGAGSSSRRAGSPEPRSQLVRLLTNGGSEIAWSSTDETIFSLLPDDGGVWMGTGLDGHLYRVAEQRVRLARDFEEKQVVGLAPGAEGPVALTTNAAAVWKLSNHPQGEGTYTSASLDAGQVARFGVFHWLGDLPPGADVRVAFRTGYAAEPDATWSGWSAESSGREVALPADTRGRFLQYRLRLVADKGEGPRVVETRLSYRQQNLRPSIDSFESLDPGQILVPSSFNPAEQTFEPASPNREGIFTTLRPASTADERMKKLWKLGWLTLQWQASDPNDDTLRYRLEVRPESAGGEWLEMVHDLAETHWAFDATALPDGVYRFRVSADDGKGNEPSETLTTQRESAPVTIDHTPPALRSAMRKEGGVEVTVYDATSPLRQAEVSVDGGAWRPARPEDGLLDGQSEVLMLDDVPKSAHFVLLRVIDDSFNVRTFDLLAELTR